MSIRIAVVGSGPSGFYAAGSLLGQTDVDVEVDMFDRLPTPFGLVRAGVAPDHPKIKSVTRVFDKTARHPGFRYYGNIEVGRDVSTAELDDWYDAVIYAHGAGQGKRGGVPGEELPGNHPAAELVGWYNGHPDRAALTFPLTQGRAVVIGNGNVALDIARLLAMPVDELATTDVADHALRALARSRIEEIVVLGRRGPAHAAFTHPELLELGKLPGVGVIVEQADLDAPRPPADSLSLTARNNLETLAEYAERDDRSMLRRIVLRFLASPLEICGDGRVADVVIGRNTVDADGSLRTTGHTEVIQAGLVVHAVGYAGTPMPGLPFDEQRGVIPNDAGRITPGRYVAGWIKRGPSGVIGTNRACAFETVNTLLEDLREGRHVRSGHLPAGLVHRLLTQRVPELVDYDAWTAIDAHECDRGAQHGRPRIKLTQVPEMVAVGLNRRSA